MQLAMKNKSFVCVLCIRVTSSEKFSKFNDLFLVQHHILGQNNVVTSLQCIFKTILQFFDRLYTKDILLNKKEMKKIQK